MHLETYPAFLTPKDEEPSLSSSEEKSSEFDWLERKRTRKQKYIWKAEQELCILVPCKIVQRMRRLWEQALERYLYENYNNNIYKVIQPFSKLNN